MFNRIAAITIITLGLTLSIFGQDTSLHGEAGKAFSYFHNIRDQDFESYITQIRLPEVSADHRAEVLENLSRMEEASISDRDRLKIDAILPILRFHNHQNSIEIKVVEFNHAFVKLQSRAVLLISDKAFNMLSIEELQAMAAHEMAHDYFWREYFDAKNRKQYGTLREIELLCDGVAIITLQYLNLDSRYLISGTDRLNSSNARIIQIDHLTHPPAGDRARFTRAISEFLRGRESLRSTVTQSNRY